MPLKINSKNFMWGSIVVVVIIFVAYSLITKNKIKIFEIPGKMKIEFEGQVSGNSISKTKEIKSQDENKGEIYINIPGKSHIALSTIDEVLIVSGANDPINRHKDLALKVLESGDREHYFQEEDQEGMIYIWIASQEPPNCYYFNTLLKRNDGTSQLAFRKGCKKGSFWSSEIAPDLLEFLKESKDTN
jgi:hypothetical protein